jgi:hypothetical protein
VADERGDHVYYHSRNLMHTLRLLDTALDIAGEGALRIRRPDREWLLRVRTGEFDYETLVAIAEEKLEAVRVAFGASALPDVPDRKCAIETLLHIRVEFGGVRF